MEKKKGKVFIKSIQFLIVALLAVMAFIKGPQSQWIMIGIFGCWCVFTLITFCFGICAHLLKKLTGAFSKMKKSKPKANPTIAQIPNDAHEKTLLRHVEHRISEKLKTTFPEATWEWRMEQPVILAVKGGTGRIKTCNTGEYNYADVTLDQYARMNIYMMNVSSLNSMPAVTAEIVSVETPVENPVTLETENAAVPEPVEEAPVDVNTWFNLLGKKALDEIITDLNAHGHSKLVIKENGDIFITDKKGTEIKKDTIADMPGQATWPELITLLIGVGLKASAGEDKILLSW